MAFNKLHIHMKSCRMLLYVWTQIIVLRTCIVHRYWANEITLPFSFVKQWNRCIQRLLAMYCYCSCCHGWNRVFHWSISWSGIICEFLMFAFAFCFEKNGVVIIVHQAHWYSLKCFLHVFHYVHSLFILANCSSVIISVVYGVVFIAVQSDCYNVSVSF